MDDSFPQGLLGGGSHAVVPAVAGRLSEETTVGSRLGSVSLLVLGNFSCKMSQNCSKKQHMVRESLGRQFRFLYIGFLGEIRQKKVILKVSQEDN